MGPLKGVMSMIPGLGKQLQGLDVNEDELKRVEAIVLSMTAQERRMPHVIDGSRRKRIAAGSGTTIQQDVNKLLLGAKADAEDDEADGQGKKPGLPQSTDQRTTEVTGGQDERETTMGGRAGGAPKHRKVEKVRHESTFDQRPRPQGGAP